MVRVEQITGESHIEGLAPQWQALWQRIPHASPFQSPDWLLPWWSCFGNSTPLVIAAYNDDQLIGLLPLFLLKEPACRKLLPFGVSLSDYLDALVDPSYPGLAGTLLEHLIGVPGWDECHLPNLPPGAALLDAACPGEFSENKSGSETCPILSLPGAVEALREIVPRKTLRYLRQARYRAASVGVATVSQPDADTLAAHINELFRLHERRWERLAGQGVCAHPTVRSFHLRAAKRLLDAGMLRLYLLRIGDSPVAAYYGFNAKGEAYAYLSGFDPDWIALRPGAQLIGHAVAEAIREGAREFHFLRGGEAYKYAWGAVDRPNTARTLRRLC
jgi:CelD/BcsL family acetyltransferase involved in cellulose biosynthesis